ncbi:MAG TPA: hydroxymethylpyrimidine/phosphomethylpyrimidine kinase [Gammaproteobacteria bacterium]
MESRVPVVMTFSGHDPSGGAGTQADIEVLASMGCHAVPVVTALTVQDTRNVSRVEPVAAELITAQAQAVLADITVSAFKVGLLGGVAQLDAVAALARACPEIPLVVDPILAAGGGTRLAGAGLVDALRERLLPITTVVTPNSREARLLAPGAEGLDACAEVLLALGCEFVLVTGTHEAGAEVHNRLYARDGRRHSQAWPRLEHEYHGSGCTLAAGLAGLLAQGRDPFAAALEAQQYTWEALNHGYRIGRGQHIPNRLFWAGEGRERRG